MTAKVSSTLENTKATTMESFIIDTLLRGESVIIPDFGHLELKIFGERRTVLFKPSSVSDSFLEIMPATGEKEKRGINLIYSLISLPLKEGKIVNLPKVGIFRPIKRENGEVHISYLPSSYLRKSISKEGEDAKDEKGEKVETEPSEKEVNPNITLEKVKTGEAITKIDDNERGYNKRSETKGPIIPPKSTEIKKPLTIDSVKPQDEIEIPKSRNISGIILVIVAVISVVVIIGVTIHSRHLKKAEEQSSLALPNVSESIDLTVLAQQHYGNPVFWIYIYKANIDKLKSPINIPKNVSLVIPDLKSEFDVDVTDSMEIQRANILSDIILNYKSTNK